MKGLWAVLFHVLLTQFQYLINPLYLLKINSETVSSQIKLGRLSYIQKGTVRFVTFSIQHKVIITVNLPQLFQLFDKANIAIHRTASTLFVIATDELLGLWFRSSLIECYVYHVTSADNSFLSFAFNELPVTGI